MPLLPHLGSFDCKPIQLLWIIFISCTGLSALAPTHALDTTPSYELSQQREWLSLLQYQRDWFGQASEISGGEFFFAANGNTNPLAELQATLQAFSQPVGNNAGTDDAHPLCRFPARRRLIAKHLPSLNWPVPNCSQYEQFQQQFAKAEAYLVFAGAYLANPASSFGHVFLRLAPTANSPALLNPTINFAVPLTDVGPVEMMTKGLLGGWQVGPASLPYYRQVNEYNHGEMRQLWEYRLTFSPAQRQRLLDHLWELDQAKFGYYFIHKNCVAMLASLLDSAWPNQRLTAGLGITAVPSDLLQLLHQRQLLATPVILREPLDAVIQKRAAKLSPAALALVEQLVAGLTPEQLPMDSHWQALNHSSQATVLDTAIDVLRYHQAQTETKASSPKQEALILARALLPASQQLAPSEPEPMPKPRPSQTAAPYNAHPPGRLSLSGRYDSQLGWQNLLHWRLVQHDLLDPNAAYPLGTEVSALALSAVTQHQRWQLEQLQLVSVRSYRRWHRLLNNPAWDVQLGLQRTLASQQALAANLSGSWGQAWSPANHGTAHRWYALARIHAAADWFGQPQGLNQGWQINLGPTIGWLWRLAPQHSLHLQSQWSWDLSQQAREQFSWQLQHQWSTKLWQQPFGLRLGVSQQRIEQQIQNRFQLDLHWYF